MRILSGNSPSDNPGTVQFVDDRFFWFTLFVGANLFQSGLTGWCPAMAILKRAGLASVAVRP
ncbi:MAG: DUF2892 domain-containing protein [Acidobacteria bacterium]|nr:DUF2892 domain-containing protein [Acidobacteriota bacterium]